MSRDRRPLGRMLALAAVALSVFAAVGAITAARRPPSPEAEQQEVSAAASRRPLLDPAPRPRPKVVEPPAGGSDVAREPDRRASGARPRTSLGLDRLVGQKVMTGMAGTWPSASLLGRVRRGHVGGVILFGENVSANLRGAIAALQHTAVAGGNPRLLIAIDQEGGPVRRLPAAPPRLSPARMSGGTAAQQGMATGRALAAFGINTDLAPVADVGTSGFLGSRAFGSSPSRVAVAACRFAGGLQAAGVNATFKHFPGLGRSPESTDVRAVTLSTGDEALWSDLLPYRSCIETPRMVMVSNATYPAFDPYRPAVFSRWIIHTLLRERIGFGGVTISDALSAPGVASPTTAARATHAGIDILLYVDEQMSARAFHELVADASSGRLSRPAVEASARRIRALPR